MLNRVLKHLIALVCLSALAFAADAFPRVNGQTFAERVVTLPDVAKGKDAVLVISFTRAAQDQTQAWGDRLKKERPNLTVYQVLELEDVPRLFRGFVRGSIRRGIPKDEQDKFILLFEGQDALKKIVSAQISDEAYVVLLDTDGNLVSREHGAVDDKKLSSVLKPLAAH